MMSIEGMPDHVHANAIARILYSLREISVIACIRFYWYFQCFATTCLSEFKNL